MLPLISPAHFIGEKIFFVHKNSLGHAVDALPYRTASTGTGLDDLLAWVTSIPVTNHCAA